MPSERLSVKLYEALQEWAEKDGIASKLEEQKKIVLAQVYNYSRQAKENGSKDSEMLSIASETYSDHVIKMVEARTESNIAKARVEACRVLIEEEKMKDMKLMQETKYANGTGGV